jgi:hypothetical protein
MYRMSREAFGNLVRPDGHGVWRIGGRVVPFWLEMDSRDRGTGSAVYCGR